MRFYFISTIFVVKYLFGVELYALLYFFNCSINSEILLNDDIVQCDLNNSYTCLVGFITPPADLLSGKNLLVCNFILLPE